MDKIHDELDQVKLEAEKLKEECRAKTELYHSLRKAQSEQLAKSRQDKLEIDKLARELNTKSEEIHEIRQMYEELQSNLQRKDLFLQQISSANEKLRAEHSEKIAKLEGENKDLVSSLDKASVRIRDLEEKTNSSSEEIAGLKRLLSVKTVKSFEEADKNASNDLKQRDEYILKLEEENRNIQSKLKWKNEQFSHLEEAHSQLQTQFQASKMEWQKEKSLFIHDISNLQTNLDAQVRVSENLEMELRLSNQVLAREESRRRVLEIEVSESRAKFENVYLDCQVAKSEIEELTLKRDDDIADLRMLLRKKEILINEMNYKTAQLERENSELLVSLKDTQESLINSNASSSSFKKFQKKHEKLHNKCRVNLREKEDEWDSQREKLMEDLKNCLSDLDGKDLIIKKLQNEVEDGQWLLEAKNEECSVLIMVLRSEFYIAYTNLFEEKTKLSLLILQIEEKNLLLNKQLVLKNTELDKVHAEINGRCNVLKERVESLENVIEEELTNEYKTQKEKMEKVLKIVNMELANRTSEIMKSKLELEKTKAEMETLKLNLEESQQSLKDKDVEIDKLQGQVCELKSVILAKHEAAAAMLDQEKHDYNIRLVEYIKSLENEIDRLKNELGEREAALSDLNNTLEQENKRFSLDIKEKIQQLEREFESLVVEKNAMLHESLKEVETQKMFEIEEKSQIIINLEKQVRNEVEFREKSLIQSKQEVLQLEASMQELKIKIGVLESDKQALLEDVKNASTDKENLIAQLEGICGKIGIFCREDTDLVNMLENILHVSEENSESTRDLLDDVTFLPSRKSIQVIIDERTPLRGLDC